MTPTTRQQRRITPRLIRALGIIRDHKPGTATQFAELMWPESLMHKKRSRGGRGAAEGKAAWLCAGSYLSRIERAGWIYVNRIHSDNVPYLTLTYVAIDALADNESDAAGVSGTP